MVAYPIWLCLEALNQPSSLLSASTADLSECTQTLLSDCPLFLLSLLITSCTLYDVLHPPLSSPFTLPDERNEGVMIDCWSRWPLWSIALLSSSLTLVDVILKIFFLHRSATLLMWMTPPLWTGSWLLLCVNVLFQHRYEVAHTRWMRVFMMWIIVVIIKNTETFIVKAFTHSTSTLTLIDIVQTAHWIVGIVAVRYVVFGYCRPCDHRFITLSSTTPFKKYKRSSTRKDQSIRADSVAVLIDDDYDVDQASTGLDRSMWRRFLSLGGEDSNEPVREEEENFGASPSTNPFQSPQGSRNPFSVSVNSDIRGKENTRPRTVLSSLDSQLSENAFSLDRSIPATPAQVALIDAKVSVPLYAETQSGVGRTIVISYQLRTVLTQPAVITKDAEMDTCVNWKRFREFEGLHDNICATAKRHRIEKLPAFPSAPRNEADEIEFARASLEKYCQQVLKEPVFFDDFGEFLDLEDKVRELVEFRARQALEHDLRAREQRSINRTLEQKRLKSPSNKNNSNLGHLAYADPNTRTSALVPLNGHSRTTSAVEKESERWPILAVSLVGVSRWLRSNSTSYMTYDIKVTSTEGDYTIYHSPEDFVNFRTTFFQELKASSSSLAASLPLLNKKLSLSEGDTVEQYRTQCAAAEIFLQSLCSIQAFHKPSLLQFLSKRIKKTTDDVHHAHHLSGQRPEDSLRLANSKWSSQTPAISARRRIAQSKKQEAGGKLFPDISSSPSQTLSTSLPHSLPPSLQASSPLDAANTQAASLHRFEAFIPSFDAETPKSPIMYTIIVREFFDASSFIEWTVIRRFRDFERMHVVLKAMFSEFDFPSLPPKINIHMTKRADDRLKARRAALEIYIQRIINVRQFQVDEFFSFFDLNSNQRNIRVGNIEQGN